MLLPYRYFTTLAFAVIAAVLLASMGGTVVAASNTTNVTTTTQAPSGNTTNVTTTQAPSGNTTNVTTTQAPSGNTTNVTTTRAPVGNETNGNVTKPPTTTTPRPIPTTPPPPLCAPLREPRIILENTVNASTGLSLAAPYQRTGWIRFSADIQQPYIANCSDNTTIDVSALVRLSWSIYNTPPHDNANATNSTTKGPIPIPPANSQLQLPPIAIVNGPIFSIPPYALGEGDKIVVVRAVYGGGGGGGGNPPPNGSNNDNNNNNTKNSTAAFRIRLAPMPAPRVVQQGGSIEVGKGQGFFLSAIVRVPCDNATDAEANCARSEDGLKAYVCGGGGTATICPASAGFSWECEGIACGDVLANAFRRRHTSYPNVSIAVEGLYNITAVFRYTPPNSNSNTTAVAVGSDSRVIRVVANATIPLSVLCTKMPYKGQNGTCTAIAPREYRLYRWSVNGVLSAPSAASAITVAPDVFPTTVSVAIVDERSGEALANASIVVPAAAWVELECATTGANANTTILNVTGLSTMVTVRCDAIVKSPQQQANFLEGRAPTIAYSFRPRSLLNETSLTPTAPLPLVSFVDPTTSQKVLSNSFTFVAPPYRGVIEVVARLAEGLGGRPITFKMIPQHFFVNYTFTAGDAQALAKKVEASVSTGDIGAVVAAASQLGLAARGGSATKNQTRDAATAVIGALSNVTLSASAASLAALPDTTAKTVVDAVIGAVLDTSARPLTNSTRSIESTLPAEEKQKAGLMLVTLARQAVTASGDNGFIDTVLTAAESLSDVKGVAANVTDNVLGYLLTKATAGGPAIAVGSGGVRLSLSSYAVTDSATAKATSDTFGNVVGLPSGFSFTDGSSSAFNPTQVAALSMTTIPPPAAGSNDTTTPANSGDLFASPVTILNIYIDGKKANVANRSATPVFIRLSVSPAVLANLSKSAAAANTTGDRGLAVRYWDDATKGWRNGGITTLGKCSDYQDNGAVTSTAAQDKTHVCALVTHFTSFAVFEDTTAARGKDGSTSTVGIIVGVVIAGVVVLAIIVIVVVVVLRSKRQSGTKVGSNDLDASERYTQEYPPNKPATSGVETV